MKKTFPNIILKMPGFHVIKGKILVTRRTRWYAFLHNKSDLNLLSPVTAIFFKIFYQSRCWCRNTWISKYSEILLRLESYKLISKPGSKRTKLWTWVASQLTDLNYFLNKTTKTKFIVWLNFFTQWNIIYRPEYFELTQLTQTIQVTGVKLSFDL